MDTEPTVTRPLCPDMVAYSVAYPVYPSLFQAMSPRAMEPPTVVVIVSSCGVAVTVNTRPLHFPASVVALLKFIVFRSLVLRISVFPSADVSALITIFFTSEALSVTPCPPLIRPSNGVLIPEELITGPRPAAPSQMGFFATIALSLTEKMLFRLTFPSSLTLLALIRISLPLSLMLDTICAGRIFAFFPSPWTISPIRSACTLILALSSFSVFPSFTLHRSDASVMWI